MDNLMPEQTVFEVIDKSHWEILQMEREKLYSKNGITGTGEFWMRVYPLEVESAKKKERFILWGK